MISGTVEKAIDAEIVKLWETKPVTQQSIDAVMEVIATKLDGVTSIDALFFNRACKFNYRGFEFVSYCKTPMQEAKRRLWNAIKQKAAQQRDIPSLLFEQDICTDYIGATVVKIVLGPGVLMGIFEARQRANQMVEDAGSTGKTEDFIKAVCV